MKIILGSNNHDKVEIIKKALEQLHLEIEVEGVKVASEITDQPLDKETTLKGSQNRARNARKAKPNAEFYFGLEGGLHDYGEGYHLVTFATLIDKSGNEYTGEGVEIHLPEKVSAEVKNGGWFGEVIRIYAKEYDIDENLITRETPFIEAIERAYANYLKANDKLAVRKKSIAFIFNEDKEFLLVQLQTYGPDHWNMPGGGIDEGEDAQTAMKRELKEELGTDKFEVIEESKIKNQYDWPDFVIADRIVRKNEYFSGQEQTQFIVKFTGVKDEIKIQEEEIKQHKWVKYDDLEQYLIFPDQWDNFKVVVETSSFEL